MMDDLTELVIAKEREEHQLEQLEESIRDCQDQIKSLAFQAENVRRAIESISAEIERVTLADKVSRLEAENEKLRKRLDEQQGSC